MSGKASDLGNILVNLTEDCDSSDSSQLLVSPHCFASVTPILFRSTQSQS